MMMKLETLTHSLSHQVLPEGIRILKPPPAGTEDIITPEALRFVAKLERAIGSHRRSLLNRRVVRQIEINSGELPDFSPVTENIRRREWRVAPCPADLADRRVELCGPPGRRELLEGLNSTANVFIADFEDSLSPTWNNILRGHRNLRDAVHRTLTWGETAGPGSELGDRTATILMKPRGWHLEEKHVIVDGMPVSASLFDFGIHFYHNAARLLEQGSGPYYLLPKLESHAEARLWNDAFSIAQDELGIPFGTVRATVLIESILAAFEMNEILYELRDHASGLAVGRWDYIFSILKKFRSRPEFQLPDRTHITMGSRFLQSLSILMIQTCHRRHAHAIGGSATELSVGDDPVANADALLRVRTDKEREVDEGYDGTTVGDPWLLGVAGAVFNGRLRTPNQFAQLWTGTTIEAADLLTMPRAQATADGLRLNVAVSLRYLESWLRGQGRMEYCNLVENTATAEVCRAQLWQWLHQPAGLFPTGSGISPGTYRSLVAGEQLRIREELGEDALPGRRFHAAEGILDDLVLGREFVDFLTAAAYDELA